MVSLADDFCPYVGLQPYTDAERDYFFGRERDQRVISSNLYAASLTILYGESGVGKSSVLLAGVVPYLRSQPRSAVVVFREWQRPDFLDAIKSECLKAVELARQQPLDIAPSLPLDDLLCTSAQALGGSILVLFDQFEEYFLYHPDSDSGAPFDSEFARAVNREDVDAGFLIAIREDALSKLDRFRARIPSLLGNTLRLRHLGAADAEAAIRKPLDVFNARSSEGASPVQIEDELVRSVLAQVRTGQVSLGQSAGVGQAQTGEDTTRIEAPFLQLVMTRLWEGEGKAHSHMLRASTLQRLGGARQIVASHLDSVMVKLDAVQQEVCSRFFDRLVTPSGSKIACGADDLTKWAGDLASHVPVVLQTLSDRRLLRGVAGPADRPQAQRFEIFHDVLAPAVLAWRTRYIEARERAEAERRAEEHRRRAEEQAKVAKRLRRLAFGLLGVIVLAIGAASYAWVQRDEAERQRGQAEYQSRLATARYLVAETRLHLHDQLDLALLLGVEASRRTDTDEVKSSLVDALLANPFLTAYLRGNRDFTSVAFSRDGKTLAAGGVDSLAVGRVIVWDVNTHRPLGPPLAHAGPVQAVALSPDGTTLASGSCEIENNSCKQGEIRLWDMASREPSGQPLKGHTGLVRALAFSPDGRTLASASLDGTLIFWDIASREPMGPPLAGHQGWITSLAFTPDGKTLASAGCGQTGELMADCKQGGIRFWSVDTRQPLDSLLSAHDNYVLSLAFNPDGAILASSGLDGTLVLWDAVTRQALGAPLKGQVGVRGGIAFSPDGTILAAARVDNAVVLWDVATRQPLGAPLTGHTSFARDSAFSHDGQTLASASSDGSVILWDVGSRLRAPAGKITGFGFSQDGKTLVGVSEDNTLSLWDLGTRRLLAPPLTGHRAKIVTFRPSPDGKILASADEDGTLILWDIPTGAPLGPPLMQHSAATEVLAFSPDSRILASASNDMAVILWDVATHKALGPPLQDQNSPVIELEFSPDGKILRSSGTNGTIMLWDIETRQPLGSLADGGAPVLIFAAFSPEGPLLVSGKMDGTLMLWDVATRRPLGPALTRDQAGIVGLAFRPDGKSFASITTSGTVVLWDVATRQPVGSPFTAGSVGMNRIRFSPDGKVLVVLSMDNQVRFWDIATRRPLAQPISGENDVALSKEFTVASVSNDGILLRDVSFLTDATRNSWQARACGRANRNLTRAEWQHYFGDEPYRATCPGLPLDEDAAAKTTASGQ